jgi:hypothetical protein
LGSVERADLVSRADFGHFDAGRFAWASFDIGEENVGIAPRDLID